MTQSPNCERFGPQSPSLTYQYPYRFMTLSIIKKKKQESFETVKRDKRVLVDQMIINN